jgi:hypothetical protein
MLYTSAALTSRDESHVFGAVLFRHVQVSNLDELLLDGSQKRKACAQQRVEVRTSQMGINRRCRELK